VVAFYGEMGCGKTTCISGVCAGLDVPAQITSPTFTLINEYQGGRFPVYHFDFYRLGEPQQLIDLGLEEYFYNSGVCLIEWPELVKPHLPPDTIQIHLTWPAGPNRENQRRISVLS